MIINWLQPYCTDKNIGREYNRLIELMPDGSWIGLVDHDAMFLRPDSKEQISKVVETNMGTYEVFGIMTNRLWGDHQRHLREFNTNPDINYHLKVANLLHEESYGKIKETRINIAGLCLVFNKDTWQRVGGFRERNICLDREFTDDVMASGGRLAICTGVYVFHLYRWGQERPGQYVKHLI